MEVSLTSAADTALAGLRAALLRVGQMLAAWAALTEASRLPKYAQRADEAVMALARADHEVRNARKALGMDPGAENYLTRLLSSTVTVGACGI